MIFTIALMLLGQTAADITASRQLFEAGQYEQIVSIQLDDASPPSLVYLVAQSHDRLTQVPAARDTYGRLIGRPDTDPWHHVGQSALLLLDARPGPAGTPPAATVARAVAAAEQASTLTPSIAEAQYQLGLAQAERRDYAKAASAFEAAISLDPQPAYAHYFAGLSYYQEQRIDLMAKYFEAFLTLAPDAPERAQVDSIMRTVRGR
jgi:TolA-binding protein